MPAERIKVTPQPEAEIPTTTQFTHSIKLEETAKGVRLSVHVYANDRVKAIDEAIGTYEVMKAALEGENIPMAPMEVAEKPK